MKFPMMLDTCDAISLYLLHLADEALILGQNLSHWCGHGPILEQDIAISNIALDLIGLSRQYYQYASERIGNGCTEDKLAYFRESREFYNHLLVERPNGDWGDTIARQFYFDTFHFYQLEALCGSNDNRIKEIATKALKETTYHAQFSAEWVIRLGDGTDESHERIQKSVKELYPYALEFFTPSDIDVRAYETGVGPDVKGLQSKWSEKIEDILKTATLLPLDEKAIEKQGGKKGIHSEQHGIDLSEMQILARSYPNAKW